MPEAWPEIGEGASDAEVVRRARLGETEAYRILLERHRQPIYQTAYRILQNADDARDVAQEAFVRVLRSLGRFDVRRPFGAWVHTISVNLAIDALRRRSQSRGAPLEAVPEPAAPPRSPSLDLEREETRTEVRRALQSLPPVYRSVLALRDMEGNNSKEIGRMIGVPHATVRWRLARARRLFQAAWERLRRERETTGVHP